MSPAFFALLMIPIAIFFFLAAALNWQWIYFDRRYRFIRDIFGDTGSRIFLAALGCFFLFISAVGAITGGVFNPGGSVRSGTKEFESPTFNFAALFPGKPDREQQGSVTLFNYYQLMGGEYSVGIRPIIIPGSPQEQLTKIKEDSASRYFASLDQEEPLTLDGKYPGIALGGEGTDGDGYTRLNIFVVDGREYFIGTVGADRNKAEKFISSFHLLNSPGGGKPATSGHVADASGQGPSNDSGNGSSVFGNQGANEQNSPEVNVEELGTPEQSLPLHSHPSWSVLWLTQEEEPDEDPDFQSLAPNGGYLVGLIATESRWSHVPVVGSLQPVYQVDDRYVLGERFGEAKGKTIRVLAEPGYVLGGVKARKARNLDGLQLVFMKLENGQLIRSNFIQSRWIGNSTGGSPFALDGSKGILVGIRGDLLDSGEVGSIELAYIGEDPTEVETTGTEEKAFSSSGGGDSGEDAPGGNGAENTIAEPAEGEELDKADVAGMSKPVGHDRGTPYRDIAPEGAIMTGLQVTYGLWMGRDRFLGSLQPLYQTADGKYVKGEVHGKERLDQKGNAVAKPGYAVGGLAVRTGLKINAIQVIFMKKKANGRLDPNDTYTSEWFGTETGGGPVVLEGKGYPVIGIQGGYQEDVNGIQLVFGK